MRLLLALAVATVPVATSAPASTVLPVLSLFGEIGSQPPVDDPILVDTQETLE